MSSRNEICGDEPLDRRQRWCYVATGWNQILHSFRIRFCPRQRLTAADRAQFATGASPLRVYTNAAMMEIFAPPHGWGGVIVDIGCGSGDHFRLLRDLGVRGRYIGVDVDQSPAWADLQSTASDDFLCNWHMASAETLAGIPIANVSMSSSSLEHMQDDCAAIRSLFELTRPGGHGVHVVPAAWSLLLYGYHGYRRYTPAELRKLFQSAGFQVVEIRRLGGFATWLFHMVWIGMLETAVSTVVLFDTLTGGGRPSRLREWIAARFHPEMRMDEKLAMYGKLAQAASMLDRVLPWPAHGFAAIVQRPDQ